ncbi:Hypothetical protein CAP_5124 [Chondromyces apiculatus DSM 436]|uniref:Protein kinase domain-containing protein n=1 Tax=Chondromyces apiculatus DSM 436 TaxID=1192034 RepID=A0A017T4W3_9BACT|nr:Hypothetical protein CAP_5124 [Chondromyces apiculatus DSM 436]
MGAGGFSVVFAATREADGAPTLLKVGRVAAPVLLARFQREASAMERVGPPHVPTLHAQGRTEDGRPYLVMERFFGQTLAEWLATQPSPPPLPWTVRFMDALLAAVDAAHARGVVHRDLKPENIFLAGAEQRVVLLDLGLARRPDQDEPELTRTGVTLGTPHYMAPEQIHASRTAGAPADLYALGVILYELLTSRLPFGGDLGAVEHGHLALRPPRPREHAPVPAAIEELVLACLAKEPSRRPPSAAALREALAAAAATASAWSPAMPVARHLLAEGRHPVVLAVIEGNLDARFLAGVTARHGGILARQQARRAVAVFSGQDVEHPAGAALAMVRTLAEVPGTRAALHLDRVLLRRRKGAALTAYGAAVERPDTWLPVEPWSGVRFTPAFAAIAPDSAAATIPADTLEVAPGTTGSRSTVAPPGAPLLGRDEVLTALEGSARVPFVEARPALFTLLGERGLGKSRLAAEAAAIARRLRPEATVVPLYPPVGTVHGLGEELLRNLAALAPGTSPEGRPEGLAETIQRAAREAPVAIVLDDAQLADPELLDALELSTLDGSDLRLWVVVAAQPGFERTRPGWGSRTRFHTRRMLSPLTDGDAVALAAELLRPAEYPPAAALEHLARWGDNNPASLTEIARALKRAGVVRRRSGTTSWYVATADLQAGTPSPAWAWIASRRLAMLPPELAALARLCAVLGASFTREELERVQDALDRAGRAATPVDVGYGLRALVDVALLECGPEQGFFFASAMLRDALHETLEPAHRTAAHEHALAYWKERAARDGEGTAALEAVSRHAAACGRPDEAGAAHLALGDLGFARHRHVDADQRYTAALTLLPEHDLSRRAAALAGRGRSRYRIGRAREAQEDLVAGRDLAARTGDRALVALLLLEEATALDWMREFSASAARVDEARPLVHDLASPRLAVRLRIAEGRTCHRRNQTLESIALLRQAVEEATALEDDESRSIALLLLAPQLALTGELVEAQATFGVLIDLLTATGDLPHLASAHTNRTFLWEALREPDRALADLAQAMALTRQLGDPMLERLAACNVSDVLYCAGRSLEALEVAQRACFLEERFFPHPVAWGRLNAARALVMLERHDEARSLVEALVVSSPVDLTQASRIAAGLRALLEMLQLVLSDLGALTPELTPARTWDALLQACEETLPADWVLELVYWRARMALRSSRSAEAEAARQRAVALDPTSGWTSRIHALFTPSPS